MKEFLVLFVILIFTIACQQKISSSENNNLTSQVQVNQSVNNQDKVPETTQNFPKVKWIFLQEPLDFNSKTGDVIGSTALNFFETGEVTRTNVNLYKKKQETELVAFFDEVVLLGTWKEAKDEIQINFENCRCQHCDEYRDEKMSKKQMADFVPFSQVWKKEADKSDKSKQFLVSANKRFRLIKESDYNFTNYSEMINEPLKIKDLNAEDKCIAFDLE